MKSKALSAVRDALLGIALAERDLAVAESYSHFAGEAERIRRRLDAFRLRLGVAVAWAETL